MAVLIDFVKVVVDGRATILGNISIVRMAKIAKWANFANNGAISLFLQQHNGIFAVYIIFSPLLLPHNDASEKIMPFMNL